MTAAVARVVEKLEAVRELGDGKWIARCPGHDDAQPSLAISIGRGGRALVYCRSGCATPDVLRAIGLEFRDLFAESMPPTTAVLRRAPEDDARAEVDADARRCLKKYSAYFGGVGIFTQSDLVREEHRLVRRLRKVVTRLGDTEVGWTVAALAAEMECGAFRLEGRLDAWIRRDTMQRKAA